MQGDTGHRARGIAARYATIALIGAFLRATRAWADAGPPMITDDPGTVPTGHWEINVAALSEHNAEAATFNLPLLDVNYGANEHLQLKIEMPFVIVDPAHGRSHSGAGNSLIGAKWHFYDGGDDGWQLATYPQVQSTFPSARASNGIADKGVSYLLPIEAQRSFGAFDLNIEVGRGLRTAAQLDSWIAGAVVSHEVRKGFVVLVEMHDEADVHLHRDELIVNLGARVDVSERASLLLSVGRDLNNGLGATNTFLSYAAIQLHL